MPRADLDLHFDRLERLVGEVRQFVPTDQVETAEFRADLAGLLVVSIAASYESCVKETLVTYASGHHSAFGNFATNNFAKLNSRIAVSDLYSYARTFDSGVHDKFGKLLTRRKKAIDKRLGKNILDSYEQILSWRHAFAHAGIRNTTIEEAMATHRFAKRVLYVFDQAFNGA
ncbi:HEPN domain-containing protein [Bradyrhizobium sp. F1.13.3]|uniref:HEPN domain-containing protein n=1 Tax=Bradyrhizobium sp. F1.13.3 TaxID=3156351 RepID=UPI00339816FC